MTSTVFKLGAAALLFLLTATGCGGGKAAGDLAAETSVDPAGQSQTLSREIPPDLQQLLNETLEKELLQLGARAASSAPLHESSRVTDLRLAEPVSGQLSFAWSLKLAGDYDANGIVNASDLVPLGQHFGKTWDDEGWGLIAQLDGDTNGEIGLGDIVPIAQNFLAYCSEFELQGNHSAADTGWTPLHVIDTSTAVIDQYTLRRSYSIEITDPGYKYFRLLPFAITSTGAREPGLTSNVAVNFDGVTTASGWYTLAGNNLRQNLAQGSGPEELALLWQSALFPEGVYGQLLSPVVGEDGTCYTSDSGGAVAAFNPDGSLKWKINLNQADGVRELMLAADGTVILQVHQYHEDKLIWVSATGQEIRRVSFDERVSLPAELFDGSLCLASESSVIMLDSAGAETDRLNLDGDEQKPLPPLITSEGLICVGGEGYGGVEDGDGLVVLTRDLESLWTHTLSNELISSPAQLPDGRICVTLSTSVCCFEISGEEAWRHDVRVKAPIAITAENGVLVSIYRNSTEQEGYSLLKLGPDGGEQWSFWLGEEFAAETILCDLQGRIYFADADTKMRCLDADGTELWSFELNPANKHPRNLLPLALTDDGKLLIPFGDRLVCIGEGGSGIVPAPQGFSLRAEKDSFHLKWNPVEGADGYLVYRHRWQEQELLARLEKVIEYSDFSVVGEFSATYSVSAFGFLGEGPQSNKLGERVPEYHIQNGGAGDWAVHGRDSSRTFRSGVRGPSIPEELWRVMPEGEGSFGPVVCSDAGFIYSVDAGGRLCCINHLGKYAWRYGSGITGTPALMPDGGIVISRTSHVTKLDDQHLIKHFVECLSPSRNLEWRLEVPAASHVLPLKDGRVVFTNAENGLCLLNPEGQWLWSTAEIAQSYQNLQFVNPPSVSADGQISVSFVHTFFRTDYWRLDLAGNTMLHIEGQPAHLSSIEGYSIRPDGSLLTAFSPSVFSFGADARLEWDWQYFAGGLAVLSNGSALASFSDPPSLRRMDRQGKADWRTVLPAVPSSTLAADAAGSVFVGLESGEVFRVGAEGEILWSRDLDAGPVHSLAIGDDGRLFVSAEEALIALGDS